MIFKSKSQKVLFLNVTTVKVAIIIIFYSNSVSYDSLQAAQISCSVPENVFVEPQWFAVVM